MSRHHSYDAADLFVKGDSTVSRGPETPEPFTTPSLESFQPAMLPDGSANALKGILEGQGFSLVDTLGCEDRLASQANAWKELALARPDAISDDNLNLPANEQ